MQGDTTNAIKYAEIGASKYPDDGELATQNIELNLMAGNEQKIINNITAKVEKDPENENMHYYLSIEYSEMEKLEKTEEANRKAIDNRQEYQDDKINQDGSILTKGN